MARHLAIEASPSAIAFTILNGETSTFFQTIEITGKTEQESKANLSDQFKTIEALQHDFDEVTLAWSHAKSTLVPSIVLNDSTAKDVFQLCFGSTTDDFDVDYNRIAELSIVNVYEIPSWIKSFLVMKFPRVIIQHTGSHAVRRVMHKNAFDLKATVLLFDGYFMLSMAKHNKLEFYSFFDYLAPEDVLYHLTFALQQKELMNEKGSIELVSGISSDKATIAAFQELKSKVANLNAFTVIEQNDFIAKSQLLCV